MYQAFQAFFAYFKTGLWPEILHSVWFLAPLWVPIGLGYVLWRVWVQYIRADFISKQKPVLLEIKIPKEQNKSPLAMEIMLTALYQTASVTFIDTYFGGKVRPWFSFELVSIDGQVKFFIWTWGRFKNLVETQIYGQYPTVEIYEVPDYSLSIRHDPENLPFWATEFKLTKPDPYPIKTYVDYGLDKDPKEEFKIDPMTSVLEYLGSLKKGEQAWIQIVIQAHKKERKKKGAWFEKTDWKDEAKEEIKKIVKEATVKGEDEEDPTRVQLTPGQRDLIEGIERSMGKFAFDTGIRGFYISEKAAFNPVGITGLIGSFRQYSSNTMNGFKLGQYTDFDYPWQDVRRIRRNAIEKEFIDAYQRRSFFRPPRVVKAFILTTEEIATIYHFPGGVSQTPTFERIVSKKAEAPPNLPI